MLARDLTSIGRLIFLPDIRRALRVLADGLHGARRVETGFPAPPPFLPGARQARRDAANRGVYRCPRP
jgi:hypothetical protein